MNQSPPKFSQVFGPDGELIRASYAAAPGLYTDHYVKSRPPVGTMNWIIIPLYWALCGRVRRMGTQPQRP